MDLKSLVSHASALPMSERKKLVDQVLLTMPSVEYSHFSELFSEADLAEWKRRSDELEADPSIGLTWDEIKASLKIPTS